MPPERANELTLDIVCRFSEFAASHPQERLLSHLASSLGQSFPQYRIDTVWLQSRSSRDEIGERWNPEDFATTPMGKDSIREVTSLRKKLEYWNVEDTVVTSYVEIHDYFVLRENPWILMLRPRPPKRGGKRMGGGRADGELWISFRCFETARTATETAELLEFTQYMQGVKLIYTIFVALSRVSTLKRLSGEVMAFSINVHEAITQRVQLAQKLLDQIVSAAGSDLDIGFTHIWELAVSIMQGIFGSPLLTSPNTFSGVKSFSRCLVDAAQRFAGEQKNEIERVAAILAAAIGEPTGLLEPGSARRADASVERVGKELMEGWSWCYFTASTRAQQSSDPRLIEGRWRALATSTTSDITYCLWWWSMDEERRSQQKQRKVSEKNSLKVGWMNAAHVPPWLSLWFCQQLLYAELREEADQPLAEKWRFRAALAYVLRESVRVFLFGRRADYRFQPAMLAKALRVLLEYHALRVVKLPGRLDISGLLEIVGQARPGEAEDLAAAQLQHIFEVYIAGHFLCSVGLERVEDGAAHLAGRRIQSILAGQGRGEARELRSSDFLKAFSLAAMLHTVGGLLFPRWSREIDVFGQLDKGLRDQLGKVTAGLNCSAADLAETCKKELISAGYISARTEPEALQWIDEKKEQGDSDNGLLSAWFCHRIGRGVEGLSEDVLRQAVRAVLFLRAVTQPIDSQLDPVSVLLLLCDELFAWQPTASGEAAADSGRRTIAVLSAASLRKVKWKAMELKHLKFRVEQTKGKDLLFKAEISEGDRGSCSGFPRFEVMIADPPGAGADFPYSVWIELAQMLGRIRPIRSGGASQDQPAFWPVVVVHARTSRVLKDAGLTYKGLLEEVAYQAPLSIRPSLRRWLETAKIQVGPDMETMEIQPQGHPVHPRDLTPLFPELVRLADLFVKNCKAERLAYRVEGLELQMKRRPPRVTKGSRGWS